MYAACHKNHIIKIVSSNHVSTPSMAPISPLARCFLRAGSCRTLVVRSPTNDEMMGDDFGHKKWGGKCEISWKKTWSLVDFPLSIDTKKWCVQHRHGEIFMSEEDMIGEKWPDK